MTSFQVQLVFIDLALIFVLARGLGRLAALLRQPPVVGEIIAGILLGPTLFHGELAATLFPADIRPLLTGVSYVGVALFMFLVGLELDAGALRGTGRITAGAVVGSTLVPFALGILLALSALRSHEGKHGTAFAVFIGLSVSVTAFPVLARVLADRNLARTALGGIALSTAAVVDVLAWVALAAVQAVVSGGSHHWRVLLFLPYLLAMFLVVRPLLRRLPGPVPFVAAVAGTLVSAAATEAMGMHFIFGAFLFGAVIPRRTPASRVALHERTGQITALLMPVYFVVAGLQVDLGGLDLAQLGILGLILLTAVLGKVGGTYLGVRTQRLPARPAVALAVLMNTRGLTELVVLGVGLQLGLLDRDLYSLMVVMALVTTAATGPLIARIHRGLMEIPLPEAPADSRRVEPSPVRGGR
ncbi:cation:proton antiporter [Streptomyces sp. NRRL B-24484]|uniref:cation:proton antiporter domain-containing protein n=1 Tax=Streptomyces sp. NRRL B-24484 TaxID=1463833 RepID=UPI0004C211DE|nr:cation:proton antiporter [Streptomyces sp. NRRL B-24484]